MHHDHVELAHHADAGPWILNGGFQNDFKERVRGILFRYGLRLESAPNNTAAKPWYFDTMMLIPLPFKELPTRHFLSLMYG